MKILALQLLSWAKVRGFLAVASKESSQINCFLKLKKTIRQHRRIYDKFVLNKIKVVEIMMLHITSLHTVFLHLHVCSVEISELCVKTGDWALVNLTMKCEMSK